MLLRKCGNRLLATLTCQTVLLFCFLSSRRRNLSITQCVDLAKKESYALLSNSYNELNYLSWPGPVSQFGSWAQTRKEIMYPE